MQDGSHFSYNAVNFHPAIEKPYHLQGGSHFSYIVANFHPEVRIY